MTFRKALAVTLVMQALSFGLAAAFVVVSTRALGTAGRGSLSMLTTAGQLAAVALSIGFPGSVAYFVSASPGRARSVIWNLLKLLAFATLVLVLVALANRWRMWYEPIVGHEAVLILFILASIGGAAASTIGLALGHTLGFNVISVISTFLSVALLTGWHLAGSASVHVALGSQTIALLFMFLASLAVIRWSRQVLPEVEPEPLALTKQLRVASLGFLSSIFAMIMFRGDIFLVSVLGGGPALAGVYSIGLFAAESALKIPAWTALLLGPVVASGDPSADHKTAKLFWLNIAMAMTLALILIFFRPLIEPLVGSILGMGFAELYPVLLALLPRIVMQSGVTILAANLAGRGYTRYHPAACLAGMVGVLGMDLILVPRYGLIGAGVASSIGCGLALVVVSVGFFRLSKMNLRAFSTITLKG